MLPASGRVRLRGTAPSAHTVLSTRSIYGKGAAPVSRCVCDCTGIQDACLWGDGAGRGKPVPAGGGWLPGWRGDEEGCPGRQRKARGREDRNSPSSVLCGARDAMSAFWGGRRPFCRASPKGLLPPRQHIFPCACPAMQKAAVPKGTAAFSTAQSDLFPEKTTSRGCCT